VEILKTPAELRRALGPWDPGLVPTMGALHDGHLSLIERSAAENDRTVVSIFVNPLQFNDARDLAAYPRTFERDVELAAKAGANFVFAPTNETLYPAGFATSVSVSGLTQRWEGAVRPGHFAGVTTVVCKLFTLVNPARSYFGEKDFQQLAVVRRMHADLNLPGEIIGCVTVRDRDGLALSSRNARLTPGQRAIAAVVPRALFTMRDFARGGVRNAEVVIEQGLQLLKAESAVTVDYLTIVDPETLDPVKTVSTGSRALIAVRLGAIRLIDNLDLLAPPA
jgi:pantoate--beta-alanine ligase